MPPITLIVIIIVMTALLVAQLSERKDKMTTGSLIIHVKKCARCGENHNSLHADRFVNPVDIGNSHFDYFATCPTTLQPILVRVTVSFNESENTDEQ